MVAPRLPRVRFFKGGRFGALFLCALIGPLAAQEEISGVSDTPHRDPITDAERGSDSGIGLEVPYRRVFRDTGSPMTNSLRGLSAPFRIDPKLGPLESENSAMLPIPRMRSQLPFLRPGQEPDNAHFRLGPFYIRFLNVSLGLLATDNGNLSADDPEAGVIGVVRTGVIIKAQITKGLQINFSGAFTALPFEGSAGVSGLGLLAPFALSADDPGPLMRGQIVYDTRIGGWDVVLADDYHLNYGGFHDSYQNDTVLWEGFDYDESDRIGRYSYSPYRRGFYSDSADRERTTEEEDRDYLYFSNAVSARVERLMTNGVRLRALAYHENLWYNQDDRGLPESRDHASVYAALERENMRFKPWAEYRTVRVDGRDGFSQAVRAGLYGPITDQLNAYAYAGYFRSSTDRGSAVGGIRFRHIAGPYTRQTFGFVRDVDEFEDEIHDTFYYTLSQTIGPRFVAQLAARYGYRDSLDTDERIQTWRVGLRTWYVVGPKSRLGAGASLGEGDDGRRFVAHAEYEQFFNDYLSGRFSYRFNKLDSSGERDSYTENVFYMALTQYFR